MGPRTHIFTKSSELVIINNTAHEYGGRIFLERSGCSYYGDNKCFFQPDDNNTIIDSELILLSGNSADHGGDAVYGGCLSNCSVSVNGEHIFLTKCSLNNTLWDLVSSTNIMSQSTFVEQRRVVFCTNTSTFSTSCTDPPTLSVYRGQMFTVHLMVADDC